MKRYWAAILAVGMLFVVGQAGDAPKTVAKDVYVYSAVKADPSPEPGPLKLKVEVGSYVPVCVKTEQKMRMKVRDASLFDSLKLEKGQYYGGKPFGEAKHKNIKFEDGTWVMLAVKAGTTEVIVDANGADGPETKFEAVIEVYDSRGPPDPTPGPGPNPNPNPGPSPKPLASAVWVVIVEETSARTPDTAKTLMDKAFWDGLEARGNKMRPYDKDQVKGVGYAKKAADKGVSLPAVLLFDAAATGSGVEPLDVFPLTSTAAVEAKVKQVTGGK